MAAHYFLFRLIYMAHTHQVTSVNALHQKIISVVKRETDEKKKKGDKSKNKTNNCSFLPQNAQNPPILQWKLLSLRTCAPFYGLHKHSDKRIAVSKHLPTGVQGKNVCSTSLCSYLYTSFQLYSSPQVNKQKGRSAFSLIATNLSQVQPVSEKTLSHSVPLHFISSTLQRCEYRIRSNIYLHLVNLRSNQQNARSPKQSFTCLSPKDHF